jgi:hypothetical protein
MTHEDIIQTIKNHVRQDTFIKMNVYQEPHLSGGIVFTMKSVHLNAGQNKEEKLFSILVPNEEAGKKIIAGFVQEASQEMSPGGIILN